MHEFFSFNKFSLARIFFLYFAPPHTFSNGSSLTFHEKFTCIKTINVRKKKIVQMTAEIINIINNNKIPSNSVIRDKKNVSRGNTHRKKLV